MDSNVVRALSLSTVSMRHKYDAMRHRYVVLHRCLFFTEAQGQVVGIGVSYLVVLGQQQQFCRALNCSTNQETKSLHYLWPSDDFRVLRILWACRVLIEIRSAMILLIWSRSVGEIACIISFKPLTRFRCRCEQMAL